MWTADVILAVVLAACTVGTAVRQGDAGMVVPPGKVPLFQGPVPVPVPPPPPAGWVPDLGPVGHLEPWQLVLAALTALPLAARRRYPLTAFGAVIVTTLLLNQRLGAGDTTVYTFLSCVVAAYSAAVYSPHRLRALAGVLMGAGLIAAFSEENFPYVTPAVVPFLLLAGVGLGANATHVWKQRVHALEVRQEAATRLALDSERARIARELHDIVTHNVSVMVIQAGAARKVMDAAPDRAREALLAVEAGGRTALSELRQVMGLLTPSDEDPGIGANAEPGADLAPQPDLSQVPALVGRVRATGVLVELTVTGTPVPLPAGVGLTAYRVVQEALTNTVKHAAGATVRVVLEHTPDALHVVVTDTGGTASPSAGTGTGRGLTGLRERVSLHGGTLRADGRPTGGYRVDAVLPTGEPS
ncbi:two-component sensor histidine kinase [Streptomyces phaeoluteigriseus]|uniref:histidine kinase n=2 Tax=Streptomyces phaeoluteigriseus TaxID=114686 RepID=A0A1V6MLI7_9ACTN|nr:two-component sensor histidine kinase [Streptomyces phaeoluteigriseus]